MAICSIYCVHMNEHGTVCTGDLYLGQCIYGKPLENVMVLLQHVVNWGQIETSILASERELLKKSVLDMFSLGLFTTQAPDDFSVSIRLYPIRF